MEAASRSACGGVERGTGFEPAAACLEGRSSAPELPPRRAHRSRRGLGGEVFAQGVELLGAAQLAEGVGLNLADPLAREVELFAD